MMGVTYAFLFSITGNIYLFANRKVMLVARESKIGHGLGTRALAQSCSHLLIAQSMLAGPQYSQRQRKAIHHPSSIITIVTITITIVMVSVITIIILILILIILILLVVVAVVVIVVIFTKTDGRRRCANVELCSWKAGELSWALSASWFSSWRQVHENIAGDVVTL